MNKRWLSGAKIIVLRLLSIVTGLAYIKLYTRLLDADEIGLFFYLMALSYVLNALIFVPVDFYTQARIARLAKLPADGLRRLGKVVLLVSLVAAVVLALPLVWMGKLAVIDIPALYLLAVTIYLCTTARGVINNRIGPVFVCWLLLFEGVVRLAAFGLAFYVWSATARTLVYSSILAFALELLLISIYARRHLAWSDETGELDKGSDIIRATAPVAASAMCNTAQLQGYRMAYPFMGLATTSGIYAVVSNLGAVAMSAAASIFSQMHVRKLYNSEGAYAGTYIRLAALMGLGVLVVALALSGPLVGLLTGNDYVPYALAVGFGVITETGNLIAGGITIYLMLNNAPRKILIANVAATSISAAGIFVGIRWYASDPFMIGLPIATSQVVLILTLIVLAFYRPHRKTVS